MIGFVRGDRAKHNHAPYGIEIIVVKVNGQFWAYVTGNEHNATPCWPMTEFEEQQIMEELKNA